MKRFILFTLISALCIGTISSTAMADSHLVQRVTNVDSFVSRSSARLASTPEVGRYPLDQEMVLDVDLTGSDTVRIYLDNQRVFTKESNMQFYQGVAKVIGTSEYSAASAAFYPTKNILRLFFPGTQVGRYMVQVNTETGDLLATRSKRTAERHACGNFFGLGGGEHSALTRGNGNTALALNGTEIIEINMNINSTAHTAVGGTEQETIDTVTSILNDSEAIYIRDIGVAGFTVLFSTFFETVSDPFLTSDDGALLDVVTARRNQDSRGSDISHLFHSNNVANLGLAWLGTACSTASGANGSAWSLLEPDNLVNSVVTFAHEVGHNFNADHDDAPNGSGDFTIMHSSAPTPALEFSALSISSITDYADSASGSCLSELTMEEGTEVGGDTGGGDDNDGGDESPGDDGNGDNGGDEENDDDTEVGDRDADIITLQRIRIGRRNFLRACALELNDSFIPEPLPGADLILFRRRENATPFVGKAFRTITTLNDGCVNQRVRRRRRTLFYHAQEDSLVDVSSEEVRIRARRNRQ